MQVETACTAITKLELTTRKKSTITKLEKTYINIKKLSWGTQRNMEDCGVFLMRHMETYRTDDTLTSGLAKESAKHNIQLRSLRYKYCAKLILNQNNIIKDDVIERAKNYKPMETDDKKLYKELKERVDLFC